jgi:CubicO group peptidase (beta-lactamase class C family)
MRYVIAAALALSMAVVAHAKQTQPDAASLTPVQAAGVKRLKEVLAVINSGDPAAIRAYFETNTVKKDFPVPPGAEGHTFADMNNQAGVLGYRRSGGLDLVRVVIEPSKGDVVGIVRNRMTGDEEILTARVEPQAPYKLLWIGGGFPPEVMATFGLKRAVSVATTEEERLQEIGSYLKQMGNADMFSGAVVIARDGKPVFAQAYGYADFEKKIPNTLDTPFLLASLIKSFTGLAIGQLVEQGKLSYDDPLSKFLPDFPDAESAKKIQIKHLLSHTSGVGNPVGTTLGESVSAATLDRQTTVKAVVDGLEKKRLEFEPGTKHSYSNTGFILLGRIIEIVSGQDYYDYMQKHIFEPAGATSASFPLLPKTGVAVVPMALPYEGDFDFKNLRLGHKNHLGKDARRGNPAGHAIVSALDLLKLANAMSAGRLVKPETLRLHTTGKPELGSPRYGYGFFSRHWTNRPLVGHGGNSLGTCTQFGELRDTPYTVIVLSNVGIGGCMDVTERILRVLRPTKPMVDLGVVHALLEKTKLGAVVRSHR